MRHAAVVDAWLGDLNRVVLEVVIELHVTDAVVLQLGLVNSLLQPPVEPQHLHTHTHTHTLPLSLSDISNWNDRRAVQPKIRAVLR